VVGSAAGSDALAKFKVTELPALLCVRRGEVVDVVGGNMRQFTDLASGASTDVSTWLSKAGMMGDHRGGDRTLGVGNASGRAALNGGAAGGGREGAAGGGGGGGVRNGDDGADDSDEGDVSEGECEEFCCTKDCPLRTQYRHDHIAAEFFADEKNVERFQQGV
jgi:hypothetical protein